MNQSFNVTVKFGSETPLGLGVRLVGQSGAYPATTRIHGNIGRGLLRGLGEALHLAPDA